MRAMVVFVMFVVVSVSCAQTSKQPFTLTLSSEQSQFKMGQPVAVHIKMTNTSHSNIDCTYYYVNALDRNFEYEVTYEGKPEQKLPQRHELSNRYDCVLHPGEASDSGGLISTLYDFSRPGRYTIQAKRYLGAGSPNPLIKSNIIAITVLPAGQEPTESK